MGISAGGGGWIAKVKWSGLFGTLGPGSSFWLYTGFLSPGYSLLDLTEFDWAAISVD